MKKRILSLLLVLSMVLGMLPLTAFATGEAAAIHPSRGATAAESADEPQTTGIGKVALIADAGGVEDGGFNQQVHEAAKAWCEAHGTAYVTYVFEDSYNSDVDEYGVPIVEQAIAEGAKVLLLPGFSFTEATAKTAAQHPDVTYLLLDVDAYSLQEAAGDESWEIPANVYLATYREEQSGYLAGYAAVAMGYHRLGFLGGPEFPGIIRYGFGFVQGANAAAKALGVENEVEINYTYTGQFMPDDEMTAYVERWYQDDVEIVFACGGGIYASAAQAAAANGGKLIGVDADQKDQIESEFGEYMVVTSAVKNMGATVTLQLNALLDGSFVGGRAEQNGIVSAVPAENPVGLAPSTVYTETFTEDDYVALLGRIVGGELSISDETGERPAVDLAVYYLCYPACDWAEPTYEWAEDNSTVTATRVCRNDETHVETETVATTAVTTDPSCEEKGQTVYTAVFENEAFAPQSKTVELKPLGHAWGEPTYEWAEDNSTVTATRVCANDPTHIETETVDTTAKTKEPTCETAGETVYTAVFENEAFAPQSKTVELKPLGHAWGEPTYEWAEDNSTVTATRVCATDPTHVETETVATTAVTTDPSCEEKGQTVYTATFENEAFETQTRTVELEALGHDLIYTDNGDGTHTVCCSRCDYTAVEEHSFGEDGTCVCGAKNPNPFVDVFENKFYYDAVLWAVENQVTAGIDATHFAPDNPCSRGQVVTFLWRAAGSPEPASSSNPFTDVAAGKFYYKAVLWAVETGVTTGTSATTFSPDASCTRAQVVTFLWRANGSPVPRTASSPFHDVTGGYYFEAVLWAVENKITSGMNATTFAPNGICNRGQIVTFLYRSTGAELPMSERELWLFNRINEERVARGMPKLRFSYKCYDCAQTRAQELPVSYGSTRPNGKGWYTVFEDLGYQRPAHVGEIRNRHKPSIGTPMNNETNFEMIASSSAYDTVFQSYFKDAAVCIIQDGNLYYTVITFGS